MAVAYSGVAALSAGMGLERSTGRFSYLAGAAGSPLNLVQVEGITDGGSTTLFAVIKRRGNDFDIARQIKLFRLAVEINFLAHQLVSPVFARGLYEHSVFAGFDQIALAVLAVPFERVFARRARGARNGACQAGGSGHPLQAVGARPGFQVGQPARLLIPQRKRAHR